MEFDSHTKKSLRREDFLNLNTDFEKFFNDIVSYQKSEFKKRGNEIPMQVLWLVKDGKITIVPIDISNNNKRQIYRVARVGVW